MNVLGLHIFEPSVDEILHEMRSLKPRNTRTRKTVLKERRRLSNAPKSIQKRMLKRK